MSKRIGFIIDGRLPRLRSCFRHRNISPCLRGWPTNSPTTIMRFGWIAKYVNANTEYGLHYELYRPWRHYDGIVFLKSSTAECQSMLLENRRKGIRNIYDLNVDYITPASGKFYYKNMAPTESQRIDSNEMATKCDAVFCASEYIRDVASTLNKNSSWIPDNVDDRLISDKARWRPGSDGKLTVLWSGQAIKLFELLSISDVLKEYSDKIHLKFITNSLDVLKDWYSPYKKQFVSLLEQMSHEFITFTSLDALIDVYHDGGIFISPRFLDNSYNLGHSEWKITLPMATGRVVLASPQQSYQHIANLSDHSGIRICSSEDDWRSAIDEVLSENYLWEIEQESAINVVRKNFSSSVIARCHAEKIKIILQ